jgi:integrase
MDMAATARIKLTQRMISNLKPVTKETWYMDSEVTGLGVRIRPNSKPVFALRWKDRSSRDRKMTLAPISVELDGIRAVARQRLGEIAAGENPLDDRAKERHKQTVDDLVDLVAEDMKSRDRSKSYIRDFLQQYRDHVQPTIGTMLVREVTSGDVDRVLRKLRQTPALHNRVKAGLSRMFKLSIKWSYRTDDPTFGAEKAQEKARERYIDDEELTAILAALQKINQQSADVIRLLVWTGSRPKELLSARWADFDLEVAVWTKPAQTVKQKRTHTLQLHELAVATLKRMREEQRVKNPNAFVFPSTGKTGHLTTIKRSFETVLKLAGIEEDTRPYDLRKAFITRLVGAEADLRTVMALTGHTQVPMLMKHYAQAVPKKQIEALAKLKLPQ